jgi:hypothetical protein
VEIRWGGSLVVERLEKIRLEIREYYGQLNEIRAGLKPKDPIFKPDYLREWELCRQWHVMLNAGGLVDQPYLWLLEMEIVGQEATLMESLAAKAAAVNSGEANG